MSASMPSYISVSSINDFQRCPLRWCFKWVSNRVPRAQPTALVVGSTIHKAFELALSSPGMSLSSALNSLLIDAQAAAPEVVSTPAQQELRALLEPLTYWTDHYPVEATLEVETPFIWDHIMEGTDWIDYGPKPLAFPFRGRPDRVVLLFGKVWHFQHKTIAASRSTTAFTTAARRNLHECLYGMHLANKYPQYAYGGTIYNLIRKLTYRGAPTKAEPLGKILHTPTEMFQQYLVPIPIAEMDQAHRDLLSLSSQMQLVATQYLGGHFPPSNRQADLGPFGNSLDPYLPVLLGEASLDNDAFFMDRADTYTDISLDISPETE